MKPIGLPLQTHSTPSAFTPPIGARRTSTPFTMQMQGRINSAKPLSHTACRNNHWFGRSQGLRHSLAMNAAANSASEPDNQSQKTSLFKKLSVINAESSTDSNPILLNKDELNLLVQLAENSLDPTVKTETIKPRAQQLLNPSKEIKRCVGMSEVIQAQKELGADKPITHVMIWNTALSSARAIQGIATYSDRLTGNRNAISSISVVSDDCAKANFREKGDFQIRIPGTTSKETFLNLDSYRAAIQEATAQIKAEHGPEAQLAVMVGWGYISEYPEAYLIAREEGAIFVGPPAGPTALLGDKAAAKNIAKASGVPTIPGSENALADVEEARAFGQENGYPLLLKAVKGGGGRGIRIVQKEEDLETVYKETTNEALTAFNDPSLLAEKFLAETRHIEFQVIADEHRNVVVLGERDCSAQYRNQKVIESSAEHTVPLDQRREIRDAIVDLIKNSEYVGAATVEFLYDPKKEEFFFLEVNTRLQVEHPVTELQRDVDLPALQLAVASGMSLSDVFTPEQLKDIQTNDPGKHTIAARITATNFVKGQPSTGKVNSVSTPQYIPGVNGYVTVKAGTEITGNNDAQIGHYFATGETREEAMSKLRTALDDLHIEGDGIETSREFILQLLDSQEFKANDFDTKFLEKTFVPRLKDEAKNPPNLDIAIIAQGIREYETQQRAFQSSYETAIETETHLPQGRRTLPITIDHEGNQYTLNITQRGETFNVDGVDVQKINLLGGRSKLNVEGYKDTFDIHQSADGIAVNCKPSITFGDFTTIKAPCAAKLHGMLVEPGQTVEKGQDLFIYEAAKAFSTFKAPFSGTIESVSARSGTSITPSDVILKFSPPEEFEPAKKARLPQKEMSEASLEQLSTRLENGETVSRKELEQLSESLDLTHPDDIAETRIALAKFLITNRRIKKAGNQASIALQYQAGNSADRKALTETLINNIANQDPKTIARPEADRLSRLMLSLISDYRSKNPRSPAKALVDSATQALELLNPAAAAQLKSTEITRTEPLNNADLQRIKMADRGQVYVYDIPNSIGDEIENIWSKAVGKENTPARSELLEFKELVLSDPSDPSSPLITKDQSDGSNSHSVVIWQANVRLPGEQEPREIYWGANDFSVQAGSMGEEDDNLYSAAARMAADTDVPFVFYFNGAGARMIPNVEVGAKAQPLQTDDGEALILEQQDYLALQDQVTATPINIGDKTVYRIDSIRQPHNQNSLSGAGKTIAASIYASERTPTFAAAIGSSIVGKHSYALEQLEDTVQQQGCSILLTGANPINEALGRKAYRSNEQIGGTDIHTQSSVSAWTAEDYEDVVSKTLEWLSYQNNGPMTQSKLDTLKDNFETWDVAEKLYEPQNGKPPIFSFDEAGNLKDYDVRDLVTSIVDDNQFMETLAGFAPNLVSGYAKIGDLPIGVVAFQPGNTNTKRTADPAAPSTATSREKVLAGRVWDKDASEKTARVIRRMNWNKLPLLLMPNLRGFKGDASALLDRVIASGSEIARQIAAYEQPIVIHVPPHAQLRGGAWVVVDPNLNDRMTFTLDKDATAGVLEASMALETPKYKRAIQDDIKLGMTPEAAKEKWLNVAKLGDRPNVANEQGHLAGVVDTKDTRTAIFNAITAQLQENIADS